MKKDFIQQNFVDLFTLAILYLVSFLGFKRIYELSPGPTETGYYINPEFLLFGLFYIIPAYLAANLYLYYKLRKWNYYKNLGRTKLIKFSLLTFLIFLVCIIGEVLFVKNYLAEGRNNPDFPYFVIKFSYYPDDPQENRMYVNWFTFIGPIAFTLLVGSVRQYLTFAFKKLENSDKKS